MEMKHPKLLSICCVAFVYLHLWISITMHIIKGDFLKKRDRNLHFSSTYNLQFTVAIYSLQ